jgi:very-short-patch-repair endonuclease
MAANWVQPSDAQLLTRAKWMRAHPTDAEGALWTMLRDRRLADFKFRRQRIIAPYIVDFVCLRSFLVIEADGSQHADNRSDTRRDAFLARQGLRVLRFWNNDVLTNSAGVFDAIFAALTTPHPPIASQWAPPSPRGGEGLTGASLA